jgi:phosphoglycerate dehydrogenase-like enzyme
MTARRADVTQKYKVIIGYGRSREERQMIRELTQEFQKEWDNVIFSLTESKEEAEQEIEDAHIYFGSRLGPELLKRARRLIWVHYSSAGVNHALYAELLQSPLLLTSSKGLHPPYISEYIIASIFYFYECLGQAAKLQQKREWNKARLVENKSLLAGEKVLVLGLGHIGEVTARKLYALGADVHGVKRRVREKYLDGISVHPAEEMDDLLGVSDIVIDILPLTDETRGMIDEAFFSRMKDGALFINVGRGEHVVEKALLKEAHRFRGIVLDATSEEPLSADSPLWSVPNILLTQHSSGDFKEYTKGATLFFLENLARFLNGEELKGLIDKASGY